MSDDINFMIVGMDGYYTDGKEQYYRVGDTLIVRGSISGSAKSVSIKVIAPDDSIWFNSDTMLGYAKGYSYYVTEEGVKGREWSSDNGFYVKAKRFTTNDPEGMYRLVVTADSSSIERNFVFKSVEGSYSNEIGSEYARDTLIGGGYGGAVVGVLVSAIIALTLFVVRKRRGSSDKKEVVSV
ncbi:MAG: hypothetical protein ACK4FV_01285 [Candidatus Nitrosocaldus sp.]